MDLCVVSLLAALPHQGCRTLFGEARRRTFGKGEIVFHQGDPGESMHWIAEGKFAAQAIAGTGQIATLSVMGPGEVFGQLAVLRNGHHRSASVFALEPGETREIARSAFRRLRRLEPGITDALVLALANRMDRVTNQVLDALYLPAEVRVIRRLHELSELYRFEADGCVAVTQETLASLAGTSRATVNRVLRQEERRGTIRTARGKITVLDRYRLYRRAS